MTTTSRRTATTAAAALGLALALTLAACDDGSDDPTEPATSTETSTEPPTTTEPSTEETTADYQTQQIEAAEAFILDSYAIDASIRQDGFEDWQARIFPYYASADDELWQAVASGYEQYEAQGVYIEGGTEVYSIEATDWTEDPTGSGFDTVTFRVCLDSSSIVYFNEDGSENAELVPPDHNYPAEVEVMGQPEADLGWSIMAREADPEGTC